MTNAESWYSGDMVMMHNNYFFLGHLYCSDINFRTFKRLKSLVSYGSKKEKRGRNGIDCLNTTKNLFFMLRFDQVIWVVYLLSH